MHGSSLKSLLVAGCLAVAATSPAHAGAGEVAVQVVGGHMFSGEVDAASDDDYLWLRTGDERTTIRRAVKWSTIVSASEAGSAASLARLQELATAAKQAAAPTATPTAAPPPRGSFGVWRIGGSPAARAAAAPRILSLAVDAYLANWDADVEADGLVLQVAAFDEFGVAAPVDGTLEVELVGERFPPYSRGNASPVLGRWTRSVRAAETATTGGSSRFRLEFQAAHPDFQLWVSRYALVHARLTVPGQGTFEASQDGVAMRGFTPVRDRVEAAFGARFLPNEQTGRGHRETAQTAP